jgi:hypothetical protein
MSSPAPTGVNFARIRYWRRAALLVLGGVAMACSRPRAAAVDSAGDGSARGHTGSDTMRDLVPPDLKVNREVTAIPRLTPNGDYVVAGACPGEYCAYGKWTLSSGARLRREPAAGADSAGFIRPGHPVCADSGHIVVDPPGVVAISRAPSQERSSSFPRALAANDTIIVFNYLSEGYWTVRLGDSLTVAYGHWDDADPDGAVVLQQTRNLWWVHLTDPASGARGWILRAKSQGRGGFAVVDGGGSIGDDRPAACR